MTFSILVLITASLATFGAAVPAPSIPTKISPCIPASICEKATPASLQPGGPIITARDTPLSYQPGGPIITARDTPLSFQPGGPIIIATETPLSYNPGGPIITARDTPLSFQPGGPIIIATETPLSINPGGPIITARDTPLSYQPGGPIIKTTLEKRFTKPVCDIAKICELLTNDCGIDYELCYVPACAGGPATPTPTGVVPTCPPEITPRAEPLEKRVCPTVPICETLYNECGLPYTYCYAPGCNGAPDQPLSTGVIPACPTPAP